MLVLSRKVDQRIRIGDDIEVVVLSIDGHQVKLGIQAPRQVAVLRYELVEDVQQQNRQAVASRPSQLPIESFLRRIAPLSSEVNASRVPPPTDAVAAPAELAPDHPPALAHERS